MKKNCGYYIMRWKTEKQTQKRARLEGVEVVYKHGTTTNLERRKKELSRYYGVAFAEIEEIFFLPDLTVHQAIRMEEYNKQKIRRNVNNFKWIEKDRFYLTGKIDCLLLGRIGKKLETFVADLV